MLEERPSCRQEPAVSSASRNAKPVCQVLAAFGRHASPAMICSQLSRHSIGAVQTGSCWRQSVRSGRTGSRSARSTKASNLAV